METAIVVLIVAAALAFIVNRARKAGRGGCGCGCPGCTGKAKRL